VTSAYLDLDLVESEFESFVVLIIVLSQSMRVLGHWVCWKLGILKILGYWVCWKLGILNVNL
jgi:hypothetical protein